MGTRQGRCQKWVDAAIQTIVHVPSRLYEGHARTEEYKGLLQMDRLALSRRSGDLSGRLLHLAGSGTGHDQRGYRGLPATDSRSKGHRPIGARPPRPLSYSFACFVAQPPPLGCVIHDALVEAQTFEGSLAGRRGAPMSITLCAGPASNRIAWSRATSELAGRFGSTTPTWIRQYPFDWRGICWTVKPRSAAQLRRRREPGAAI